MVDIPIPDAPHPEQTLTVNQIRAMPKKERDNSREKQRLEHTEDLSQEHNTIDDDVAISSTYHMTPEGFKTRIDKIFWFIRVRSTLTELDALTEIAADLMRHLKGESSSNAMNYTHS